MKHVDMYRFTGGNFYYLKGNAAAPNVDTFYFPPGSSSPAGLNAWPANGTVYRFTPKGNGCNIPTASFISGSPSGKVVQYTYNGTMPVDSVRWDFGDGTTSTSMNPVHTFTANGKYAVCVTAYNSCGSHNYCKQQALSVGNLAVLGDIYVYPNPAHNDLIIEGMQLGDKITVRSRVGRQMLNSFVSRKKHVLNLSEIPAGTYLLMLTNMNGETGTMQFIKQ